MSKEKLIAEAKKKFERDQLVAEAHAKFDSEQKPASDPVEDVAQMGRSALEGVTLGISEPVVSGINAVTGSIYSAAQEAKDPLEFLDKVSEIDRLSSQYDADVEHRRKYEHDNPMKTMTAEMTGSVAPLLVSGPVGAAVKAGPAAIDAIGLGAKALISKYPVIAKILESEKFAGSAARIAESAISAGVQAGSQEAIKRAAQETTGFIQPQDNEPSIAEAALTGAKFGGAMKAVPEMITQGVKSAGAIGKGAARVFAGVKGESIDAYLANPERIKNAKSIEEIKMEVDATMAKLRDDVDNAVINKDQAKVALKEAESNLDDLIKQKKNITATQKADIKQSYKEAQSNLNMAFKEKTSEIKNARLPIQSDDILDSVENVKTQVSDLSKESYKLLDDHKGTFNLKGAGSEIGKIQKELAVNGQLLSKDSETAYSVLDMWKGKLGKIAGGTALPGRDVKRIIQEIDSDIRQYGDKMAGDFSDKTYNSLLRVRQVLDKRIKAEVAGYAEIMAETAKMNDLRGQFSKMFGKRESVISKLGSIDSPNKVLERDAVKQLGQLTGKDFATPLEEYLATKAQARTPIALDNLKASLPENEAYKTALAAQARAGRPEFGQVSIQKALTSSPQAQSARVAEQAFNTADEAAMVAKGALDPFKKVTPQNSENVIRTLLGDRTRKIELKKLMTGLGNVSDQDFASMIEDLRVKEAFEKPAMQGSRNVNLWAILSGAFGATMGDPTFGLMSAGAGAQLGSFMDMYGPKITRKVLDGMVAIQGMPTVQKINSVFADIPEGAKEQLKSSLIRMVTIGNSSKGVVIPIEQRFDVAKDLHGSHSLTNTEKAKAITEMNKTGAVNSQVMQKLMIGDEKPVEEGEELPQQPEAPKVDRLKSVTDFIKDKKQEAF